MVPLPTEAAIEKKTNTCTDRRCPRTTEDNKLFKKIWLHGSSHIIININSEEEKRQENLEWAGVIGGSMTPAATASR